MFESHQHTEAACAITEVEMHGLMTSSNHAHFCDRNRKQAHRVSMFVTFPESQDVKCYPWWQAAQVGVDYWSHHASPTFVGVNFESNRSSHFGTVSHSFNLLISVGQRGPSNTISHLGHWKTQPHAKWQLDPSNRLAIAEWNRPCLTSINFLLIGFDVVNFDKRVDSTDVDANFMM